AGLELPARSEDLHAFVRQPLLELGGHDLLRRGLGRRRLTLIDHPRRLEAQQAQPLDGDVQIDETVLYEGIPPERAPVAREAPAAGDELIEIAPQPGVLAHEDALEIERDGHRIETAVRRADHGAPRHAHPIEEYLVGANAAHGVDRADRDAWTIQREDEDRQALVPRQLRRRARQQPDVRAIVCASREHLLAGDHVVLAVALRAGDEAGEIRARAGLGIAEADLELAAENPRQVLLLLLFRGE